MTTNKAIEDKDVIAKKVFPKTTDWTKTQYIIVGVNYLKCTIKKIKDDRRRANGMYGR